MAQGISRAFAALEPRAIEAPPPAASPSLRRSSILEAQAAAPPLAGLAGWPLPRGEEHRLNEWKPPPATPPTSPSI
jgi:hypothetical protein